MSLAPTTSLTPSNRVQGLEERLLAVPTEVDIERARHYTAVWQETEGVEPCMRAVLALRETFRQTTIRIEEEELLAGVRTSKLTGIDLPPSLQDDIIARTEFCEA
jgi:pyruvate-formate lyase